MSNNTTSFGTLIGDLKAGLRLAKDNMLSYALAHLGLVFLMAALLAIVAVPIVAVLLAAGPAYWAGVGAEWMTMAQANPIGFGGLAVLVLMPLISFLLVFVGSIYGMSKEVVETGETRAESAFSWFKNKFLTFIATGAILTVIIIVPQLAVWGAVSYAMNFTVSLLTSQVLAIFSFIYSFITLGLTAMVFPGVVSGKGVQEAVKDSFNMATKNFERVFGIHTAIVLFFVILFSPVIVAVLFIPVFVGVPPLTFLGPVMGLGLYAVVAGILTIFWFLPMVYITYMRVYNELTGGVIATPEIPDVPIV